KKKNVINLFDICLTSFGNLELKIRGETIPESFWKKKKWKSIFVYLLTQPGFKLTRDQIIDRFFQDTAVKSAENIFRQIISHFRNLLKYPGDGKKPRGRSKQLATNAPLVLYEGKTLTLNSQLFYRIDFLEFEKLVGLIKYTNNVNEKINLSKKAVELYKGDFWEGNYETWCEELRTRYKNDYISLCENMVSNIYDLKLFDEAILYANKLRTIDRSNTHSFEIEIKSYYETGRISLAKEKMEQMTKYYKKELNEQLPQELIEKLKIILT
ncbi:MAG TPA: BTAD domain-containing putative transcriptional regulator, partial [Ignavibacteria bacterium]